MCLKCQAMIWSHRMHFKTKCKHTREGGKYLMFHTVDRLLPFSFNSSSAALVTHWIISTVTLRNICHVVALKLSILCTTSYKSFNLGEAGAYKYKNIYFVFFPIISKYILFSKNALSCPLLSSSLLFSSAAILWLKLIFYLHWKRETHFCSDACIHSLLVIWGFSFFLCTII